MKYKTADDRLIRIGDAYEYWRSKADTVTKWNDAKVLRNMLDEVPSAQPEYEEITPEEAASEIASGSIMSAGYWLDDMIRLKQMGYAICRKR